MIQKIKKKKKKEYEENMIKLFMEYQIEANNETN